MKSSKYSKEEARQLLINSIQESIIPSNPASTSSNDSNVKKLTFYSDYGYIEVLKEDYENDSLIVIPFTNKNKLYGSILVSFPYIIVCNVFRKLIVFPHSTS